MHSEPRSLEGTARIGYRTKTLVRRLSPGDVAVIAHTDLDAVAAQELLRRGVAAVLNAEDSATGRLPNRGPLLLAQASVPLIDCLGEDIMTIIRDGDVVRVEGASVRNGRGEIGRGRAVDLTRAGELLAIGAEALGPALEAFAENTLAHAKGELDLLTQSLALPEGFPPAAGRPCLVVVRGDRYREDFAAVARRFLPEPGILLLAVDGAADGILEAGCCPEAIVGDMDSVSDGALGSGARLLVHAAPTGECPGAMRLERLGLPYGTIASRGTSEDAALLLAEAAGADPIIVVGMARGAMDFLERSRLGMASSWLVRMRLGGRLIDAYGLARMLGE